MSEPRTAVQVKCPTCGDAVSWDASSPWRPFCSERCRLLDLGAWFTEERGIPVPGEEAESEVTRSPADQD
ncbi:MAG: DNA gyrase inhibitor YacG [Gammaproteobacteria bacterium]